jgi:anthranilate phosphoribosyltransferase
MVAGKAPSLHEAIPLAEASIDSGAALAKLEELVRFTTGQKAAPAD